MLARASDDDRDDDRDRNDEIDRNIAALEQNPYGKQSGRQRLRVAATATTSQERHVAADQNTNANRHVREPEDFC